jgi:4-pyridoxolactonase
MGARVYLLDGGSLVIDQSHVTWNIGAGNPVRFPVYSVLIEHDDALLLFDTGFDLEHVKAVLPFELPEQTEEQTIPAQLAKCGFRPEDVTGIINSHLHFDHVGGNKLLPNATTYLHVDELRQARSPEPFERLGYSDKGFDWEGATFELLDGDVELFPGLRLFYTPGHTIGHYSLLVDVDGGRPLMFMADVSYTPAAYENDQQAGFHVDPVAGVRSIRRVKRLVRQYDAELFFTHDMESFRGYKLAPDHYGG